MNKGAIKRWLNVPFLHDLDVRFRMLEEFGDGLSAGLVAVRAADRSPSTRIARSRSIWRGSPTTRRRSSSRSIRAAFRGSSRRCRSTTRRRASRELERAVTTLGALGVQVLSNVNGLPLDDDRFFPLFEAAARLECPILLHPARGAGFADYPGEAKSKYEIWWTFGWPYETSAAMQRLVFSRLFDRLPSIRIVVHHLGAMVPYFEGRVGYGLDQLGARTADEDYEGLRKSMSKRPYDYFKMFWADTAVFGSRAATECGLKFFGEDQVVFASDAPFDPEGGPLYIRETMRVIDSLEITAEARRKIYQGNAERLFNRAF